MRPMAKIAEVPDQGGEMSGYGRRGMSSPVQASALGRRRSLPYLTFGPNRAIPEVVHVAFARGESFGESDHLFVGESSIDGHE